MARGASGPWQEMVERGIDAVVADASISFRAPARFDDELQLRAQPTRIGTTSITTQIDVVREQALLVTGTLRHVCVATDTWAKTDAAGLDSRRPAAVRRARRRARARLSARGAGGRARRARRAPMRAHAGVQIPRASAVALTIGDEQSGDLPHWGKVVRWGRLVWENEDD